MLEERQHATHFSSFVYANVLYLVSTAVTLSFQHKASGSPNYINNDDMTEAN